MQTTPRGIIFWRTLRDSRTGILAWGLLMGGLGLLIVSMFPAIEDMLAFAGTLLENPFIKSLVGDVENFSTIDGWLGLKFFAMMPLFLGIYGVIFALGVVAGEEEKGTLDILLSTPVSRLQVVVEKVGALLVALLAILGMMLVGLLLGGLTLSSFPVSVGQLAGGVLNILPVTLFMAMLALFLSTVIRSRNTAGAVAAAIIFASYFMTTLGDMITNAVADIKYLSFYQYYNGGNVLTEGVPWAGFVGLLVGSAVLFGLSLYFFQRRDLLG